MSYQTAKNRIKKELGKTFANEDADYYATHFLNTALDIYNFELTKEKSRNNLIKAILEVKGDIKA